MRGSSVNSFFETSKKATKRRRLSLFLGMLRVLFKLALIVALASAIAAVGSYWLVIGEHGQCLDRKYHELMQDSYVYDAKGDKIGEFSVEESRETVSFGGFGENLSRGRRGGESALLGPLRGRLRGDRACRLDRSEGSGDGGG